MAQPHDVPGAADLIAAVSEFLRREVLPAAAGRNRFHALVAINALDIAGRELELGPEQAAEHAERLAAFGVADDAGLAAAIRSGRLDDRYPELKAALLASVHAKLTVSNPAYLP